MAGLRVSRFENGFLIAVLGLITCGQSAFSQQSNLLSGAVQPFVEKGGKGRGAEHTGAVNTNTKARLSGRAPHASHALTLTNSGYLQIRWTGLMRKLPRSRLRLSGRMRTSCDREHGPITWRDASVGELATGRRGGRPQAASACARARTSKKARIWRPRSDSSFMSAKGWLLQYML